ncbi:hypothetical protein ABPG72_016482 [Tetrahymena utriculariae]
MRYFLAIFSFIFYIKWLLCSCPLTKEIVITQTYFSCEQMQKNQNEQGVFILQDQQNKLSQLTTVGWYRLIGKQNQNYLLIQARNSQSQNIIKIVYNPVLQQIQFSVLGFDQTPSDLSGLFQPLLQDNWFFLKVGINLNDQNTQKSFIYYTILTSSTPITQAYYQYSSLLTFDNSKFEYLYGQQSYYPFVRSCAIIKQVLAFVGVSNTYNQGSIMSTYSSEMFLLSTLRYYFNFSMSSSKIGIFNLVPNNRYVFKQIVPGFIKYPYNLFNQDQTYFYTPGISFEDCEGVIFNFDLQISQLITNCSFLAFTQYKYLLYDYQINYALYLEDNFTISDFYLNKEEKRIISLKHPFDINKKHSITCIFQSRFKSIVRIIYIDGILIVSSEFKNVSWGLSNLVFYTTDTFEYFLNSLKLYLGGFFQNCDDCSIKVNNQDCFACKDPKDQIQQAQTYTCKQTCDSIFTQNPDQITCSFNNKSLSPCSLGLDRYFEKNCSTIEGYTIINEQLIVCQDQCKSCSTQSSCVEYLTPLFYNEYFKILVVKVYYQKYSNQLITAKFNVVLNYIYEEQEITFPFLNTIFTNSFNIKLSNSWNSNIYYYYFSRIQIFNGGFYYLDYDNTDPCFISINRKNMTCIYPKKNYVIMDGQAIPNTDCNQKNQSNQNLLFYNENTFSCQDSNINIPNQCDIQCATCYGQPNYCLTCISGRINPPFCRCDNTLYSNKFTDPISDTCQAKVCPNKCLTCDENKQCLRCKRDRISSPSCVCPYGFYDDPNNSQQLCQKCQDGFYFDENQQKCLQCFELCSSCYGEKENNCLTCSQSLILNSQNQCTCPKGSLFIKDNSQKCYNFMKTYFLNMPSQDNYELIISFDQSIDKLQEIFTQYGTDKLFEINISETIGFLIFKNTSLFINYQQKFILDPGYGRIPVQFSLGPYFLKTNMDIPISSIIPQDKNVVSVVSKFQVLFYILNSVQPTSMFLLLNLQLPPNLYQFLSQFGKYAFRNVPATQSEKVQNKFDIFGFNANYEVQNSSQVNFARLGFSQENNNPLNKIKKLFKQLNEGQYNNLKQSPTQLRAFYLFKNIKLSNYNLIQEQA